jgi:hydrogenase maturation protein HypF
VERRTISVRGTVQGVGFRPFVFRLANTLGLRGFVRNQGGRVVIEVEGESSQLDRFLDRVADDPPRAARVDALRWERAPLKGESDFRVADSAADPQGDVAIAPDAATCAACRAELFDAADRRHRHPFLTCTDCGPRLTIVTGAPYDRPRTTMAAFDLCDDCRREYSSPSDRRYHAQPIACLRCGPRLRLLDAGGSPAAVETRALDAFADALRRGRIGALKGLGGFHLACDARRDETVAELRRRKGREEKPFAIMVRDLDAAAALCRIDDKEGSLLQSPAAPIVLLRRRPGTEAEISAAVAPGTPFLGILLAYTPLHHLLLERLKGAPLVMTSGNRRDEPIATTDGDAVRSLAGIADGFLTHDRPIHVRCDDSVVRVAEGAALPIRRSRGYAPEPVAIPLALDRPTLAAGAQGKATFALGKGARAILSHHLGDLVHPEARRAYERDIALYENLFDLRPQRVVCDLHPDYASSDYARSRAEREGLALLRVQHHHAHMAACMAENAVRGPAIGVAFDGTGFGTDGAIWGGEFLVGSYQSVRRAAHFEYVGMPGGEAAIREPWRMAAAYLLHAGEDPDLLAPRIPPDRLRVLATVIDRRLNAPPTSSVGRLFDGIASMAGLVDRVSYEGQAAVRLEEAARDGGDRCPYLVELSREGLAWILKLSPLIAAVARDVREGLSQADIARRFHSFIVEAIRQTCLRLRSDSSIDQVVLSGGVFLNDLVLSEAVRALSAERFRVYRHHRVPPNDGGICLGQLAVAAAGGGTPACV